MSAPVRALSRGSDSTCLLALFFLQIARQDTISRFERVNPHPLTGAMGRTRDGNEFKLGGFTISGREMAYALGIVATIAIFVFVFHEPSRIAVVCMVTEGRHCEAATKNRNLQTSTRDHNSSSSQPARESQVKSLDCGGLSATACKLGREAVHRWESEK